MSISGLNSRLDVAGARLRAEYLTGSTVEVVGENDVVEASTSGSVLLVLPSFRGSGNDVLMPIEVMRLEIHMWSRQALGSVVPAVASMAYNAAVVHRRRSEKSLRGTKYIHDLTGYLTADLGAAEDLSLVMRRDEKLVADEYGLSAESLARLVRGAVVASGDTEPLHIEIQGKVKGQDKRWFVGVSFAASGDDVLLAARATAAVHALCDAVSYACDVW